MVVLDCSPTRLSTGALERVIVGGLAVVATIVVGLGVDSEHCWHCGQVADAVRPVVVSLSTAQYFLFGLYRYAEQPPKPAPNLA